MRISYDEAVKTEIDACVKELGQDVIERYNGATCYAYGRADEGVAYCSVGLDLHFMSREHLVLEGENPMYFVSCNVDMETGAVAILEKRFYDNEIERAIRYQHQILEEEGGDEEQ